MLHVQSYLRNGGTLDGLATELGIKAKRHQTHSNLVLLKYNQIESPMSSPIVQECRGIILDEADDWNVVARAFDKFFNYGEGHAAEINWQTARVQEKVDGSLCLVFFYKREWHVATTGTPDASGDVNASGKSFADYFWDTLNECGGFKTSMTTERNFCFIFELTGPLNRVVIPHMKPGLTLLGAREVTTWKELHPSEVSHFFPGVSVVREFSLQSIEDIFRTFDTMSPLQQEGYVIVWKNPDGTFGRVKTKHPGYVAIHHAKDGWTNKSCVEVIRTGEISEVAATVLKVYPEYQALFDEVKLRYEELLLAIEADYDKHRNIQVQKDFALAVKDSRCSGALFQLRAGKIKSIREFLAKCHIDNMMRMLGY